MLFDTRFGLVWCVRLALALLLGLLMIHPAMRSLQIAAAAGLTALPALVGHAGATAEATITPDATIYIVTKGHPTELFRVPRSAKPGTAAALEHVGTLGLNRFLDEQNKSRSRVTDARRSSWTRTSGRANSRPAYGCWATATRAVRSRHRCRSPPAIGWS